MPQSPTKENAHPDGPPQIDFAVVARDLKLPPANVEKTVQLLDDGNTIPFITRFRKDLTGGLNERQILSIKQRVTQLRALAERKAFVLKSIESQGSLTDQLRSEILKAQTSRRLEDLYLPHKPKKQAKALVARQQGLEPLAEDIFSAREPDVDLATRATDFVRVDRGLTSVDEVIRGVSDLLVEKFGENSDLRAALRKIIWDTGKLAVTAVSDETTEPSTPSQSSDETVKSKSMPKSDESTPSEDVGLTEARSKEQDETATAATSDSTAVTDGAGESESAPSEDKSTEDKPAEDKPAEGEATEVSAEAVETETSPVDADATASAITKDSDEVGQVDGANAEQPETPNPTIDSVSESERTTTEVDSTESTTTSGTTEVVEKATTKKKKKKKKKSKKVNDPFKDLHNFEHPLQKLPHHRILAINRGERAGKLKVRVRADDQKISEVAMAALVPADHPFSDFLQKCASETLSKVILPSLEREIRRELTEAAEKHAVDVFANNLRHLLLQPPIRGSWVLAIDPGFKRGCSVAILDPIGNLVQSGQVFVVGNQTRRDESKTNLIEWVKQHNVEIIAIGNGAACRQAEQLVSDAITEGLTDHKVRYVMVNEAGASIYSTSEIGREELPDVTPAVRSAVSIGRRIQDPLSELVKISPANIGVGMYQHDVKAKHLSESLDDVVAFCVNQVGVNANTAGTSLLKYVSGLNALTARRLVEQRQKIGGFKNREQLKEVNGVGDATFVQAAGFLRIRGGDCPLDSTGIHPESYPVANKIIGRMDLTVEELVPSEPDVIPPVPVAVAAVVTEEVAVEKGEAPASEAVSTESSAIQTADPSPSSDADVSTPHPTDSNETVGDVENSTPIPADASSDNLDAVTDAVETPPEAKSETDSAQDAVVESGSQAEANVEPKTEDSNEASRKTNAPDRKVIEEAISKLDIDGLSKDFDAGKLLVRDIVLSLRKPDWDPRDRIQKPVFRRGIIKVDDLKPQMQLDGQIVNVVDFGVFVDIGLGESCLVHVSQLSNQYVRDPHRFCSVGEVLKVWVAEVDTERRRVKLTAIRPGSKKEGGAQQRGGKRGRQSVGKRGDQNKSRGQSPRSDRKHRRHDRGRSRPARPVTPITDGMLSGDEPMRSFSDLMQFVKKKPDDPTSDKSDEK